MKDVRFLAIFAGLAVDIGGSLAAGLAIGIALTLFHLAQGMPVKEITTVMDQQHLTASITLDLANLGVGGFFSLLGGFVTGWIAGVSRVKYALIMGAGSVLFSAIFWVFEPPWLNVLRLHFHRRPRHAGRCLRAGPFRSSSPAAADRVTTVDNHAAADRSKDSTTARRIRFPQQLRARRHDIGHADLIHRPLLDPR